MAGYDNMFGGKPSNNSLWVGNNYSMAPGYTGTDEITVAANGRISVGRKA